MSLKIQRFTPNGLKRINTLFSLLCKKKKNNGKKSSVVFPLETYGCSLPTREKQSFTVAVIGDIKPILTRVT